MMSNKRFLRAPPRLRLETVFNCHENARDRCERMTDNPKVDASWRLQANALIERSGEWASETNRSRIPPVSIGFVNVVRNRHLAKIIYIA
jgi:hypothetical protein